MKYLDSNIFIIPVLSTGEKAKKAREILSAMIAGDQYCVTASLTMDEILWSIMKLTRDREKAIEHCMDIMSLPNFHIADVKAKDIIKAIDLMRKYERLKPRDAIHLAVCIRSGVFTIISDDNDFSGINEITWESLD